MTSLTGRTATNAKRAGQRGHQRTVWCRQPPVSTPGLTYPRSPSPATQPPARSGHDVMWVRLFRSERRVRERAVPVVRVVRAGAVRAVLVTTSMRQRGGWDAPVNNLMIRSQLACPFRVPGIAGSR